MSIMPKTESLPALKTPNWDWKPGDWGVYIGIQVALYVGYLTLLALLGQRQDLSQWIQANMLLLILVPIPIQPLLIPLAVWLFKFSTVPIQRVRYYPKLYRQTETQITTLKSENADIKTAFQAASWVAELDDSLLRLLVGIITEGDKDVAMRNLLTEFLRDVTKIFGGEVSRASVLRPNPQKDKQGNTIPYLTLWASIGMPEANGPDTSFYIGDDENTRRGVAGVTFYTGSIRVTHMLDDNNNWRVTTFQLSGEHSLVEYHEQDYIETDHGRHFPPYKAFICLPIFSEPNSEPKGVLCFDSMNVHEFDDVDKNDALLLIGRRIAAASNIYETVIR